MCKKQLPYLIRWLLKLLFWHESSYILGLNVLNLSTGAVISEGQVYDKLHVVKKSGVHERWQV